MSIQSEILRIKNNVDAAYDAVEALGGTLPQDQTVANLLAAIASIKGISTIQPSIYQGDISKQIARIAADIASAYRLCEDSGATMPASLVVGNLATCISTIPTGSGWYWGSESGEATEAWFAGLAEYLSYNWPSRDWIGKEKSVTLSSEVLGTTTHKIRCIGVNQDGERTVTFQTSNCLANKTVFGSSAVWMESTARSLCQDYYNAFPGKASVKTVSKGTCPDVDDSQNGTPVYNNETVWLPSAREMGFSGAAPIKQINSTTTKAECTYGYNASYDYYTDQIYRRKGKGDGDDTSTGGIRWWFRSRYYSSDYPDYVCAVSVVGDSASRTLMSEHLGLAPAFVIGPSTIFNWGSEDEEADEAWFARLYGFLRYNPGDSSWVGKTKSVTLSSPVLGTTTHKIVCIGVNQDADNTATFQTLNSLIGTIQFSRLPSSSSNYNRGTNYYDSDNLIYDGNASGICKAYYDAFPGKSYIKQLNKGTCVTQVSERNGIATYQNQYVWIPSEGEVGLDKYASLSYSNWTTTNGECTYGKKFQYSYYTDDSKRKKNHGDSGGLDSWWLRGRTYKNAEYVCMVYSYGNAESSDFYHGFQGVAPAFCIGPDLFDWGDEDAEADATWFADLANYLANNPGEDRWVGKEKVVTLTSAVLGTTTHKVRCIGVNQDADNTVTFQTSNCLGSSRFSSLSNDPDNYANGSNYYHADNLIYDGNSSAACKAYYDAFPGKASIKRLNKGTCVVQASNRDGTATYQNQYVWIPSIYEVGLGSYSSISPDNSTTTNCECTYGKKFYYSYYYKPDNRTKNYGGRNDRDWLTRSHFYDDADRVCCVGSDGRRAHFCHYWYSYGVAPAFCIGN